MSHVEIPRWATTALRAESSDPPKVLGAKVLGGRVRQVVLLATTDGAALVEKGYLTPPRVHRLSLPGAHVEFRCAWCGEHMRIRDASPPTSFRCSQCGRPHDIDEDGHITPSQPEAPVAAAPTAAAIPQRVQQVQVHAPRPVAGADEVRDLLGHKDAAVIRRPRIRVTGNGDTAEPQAAPPEADLVERAAAPFPTRSFGAVVVDPEAPAPAGAGDASPARCTATTRRGTRCRKKASRGDVCAVHG